MGSYTQLITVDDRGAMLSFPSIDAVRNLRSNRVRTARLTPPQGYGNAWRRLVQRNATRHSACSNASHSVVDGAPSPGIEGAPRGAHCTATAAATAAVAKVVLACSAALCFHNPAPRIRHKYLPGWLVSSPQRKRFCTLLLPRPRARKAAGCAMPSMPQTCKESAPCVLSRSGIGPARERCDEHHRPALSVRKSERGAAAGHGPENAMHGAEICLRSTKRRCSVSQ